MKLLLDTHVLGYTIVSHDRVFGAYDVPLLRA